MDQPGGRILIVDDEPSLLKMMSAYLSRLGFSVTSSSSTEQAWAEVEAAPSDFAVAVLDATMPGMSMADLAMRILRANPRVCVVAASGYQVDTSWLEAAAPGRVAFLQKPFPPETLVAALRRVLGTQEEGI